MAVLRLISQKPLSLSLIYITKLKNKNVPFSKFNKRHVIFIVFFKNYLNAECISTISNA